MKGNTFLTVLCQFSGAEKPDYFEEFGMILKKCLSTNKITEEEFAKDKNSEKAFCVAKCLAEEMGTLENGNLNIDKMEKILSEHPIGGIELTDEKKKCIENIGKIEECFDMKKINECVKLSK